MADTPFTRAKHTGTRHPAATVRLTRPERPREPPRHNGTGG